MSESREPGAEIFDLMEGFTKSHDLMSDVSPKSDAQTAGARCHACHMWEISDQIDMRGVGGHTK
jgi:hypothetical protein